MIKLATFARALSTTQKRVVPRIPALSNPTIYRTSVSVNRYAEKLLHNKFAGMTNCSGNARPKIALVGSGQIGAMLALLAGMKSLGDVVLYDVAPGMPIGKALDLSHLSSVEGFDCVYTGSNDIGSALKDATVVIVTAGIPRKPNMSRDDLLSINAEVISTVAKGIKQHCPKAFVICITNPLDAMVHHLQKESGLPTNMVCGMSGVLDSSRFCYFLAEKLKVSVKDVNAMVIGGHGDTMVPLPRYTTVSGINLLDLQKAGLITGQDIEDITKRVRGAGGEIVSHLKTGSAFFAPASSAIKMAEAYIRDEKALVPAAVYTDGEYNVKGLYVGVPCIIGRNGIERIIELPLDESEKAQFNKSVDAVRTLNQAMEAIKGKK